MFGLDGFANFIVSFFVGIILFLAIVWLILPLVFRYLVSPFFDGSYEYRKDKIKDEPPYAPQKNEFH